MSQVRNNVNLGKVAFVLVVLLASIGLLVRTDVATFAVAVLSAGALWFLFKKPELALAIQINGFSLYLYVLYKLKVEPETVTTAGFYAFLAVAYLAGGIHLAIKRRRFELNRIDFMFGLLFALFFISYLLFSLDNQQATRKISYAPLLVIAPYIGVQLLMTREQIRQMLYYCAVLAVLMILPAFYELLANPIYSEYGRFSIYTFTNKGDNPILFGIANALLILVVLFSIKAKRKFGLGEVLLILPAMYLMLRSGARGPVISFVGALIAYVVWLGRVRPQVKLKVFVVLLVLLVAAYRFIPETTASFYEDLIAPDVRPTNLNTIQERLVLIDLSIKDFLAYPIYGVGTGNATGGLGYPHNVLIEVAAEFGAIGLLIFGLLCLFVVQAGRKHIYKDGEDEDRWLMNLVLTIFIFAFVEALFSAYMGGDTLFYSSIGMVSAVAKLSEKDSLVKAKARDYLRYRERVSDNLPNMDELAEGSGY